MTYKVKSGFIVREIGGRAMAVPVGAQTSEMHGMIALSESGALLWKALENGADENALVRVLTDNYEVEPDKALADITRFLNDLKEQGALL